jgi:HEAT repeat protein
MRNLITNDKTKIKFQMTITDLLQDKTKKVKEKAGTISNWLLEGSLPTDELIAFAEKAKDPDKATCIEAIEFCTKQNPKIADESVFDFVTKTLGDKAPRVKWESARVIGNIAYLFPAKLNKAISKLLTNAEHDGTVVRWAAAFALGEILKLKTKHNKDLLPAMEAICAREQDNGVKKKYLDAIKKTKK